MQLRVSFVGKILDKMKTIRADARQELVDSVRDASTLLLEMTIREAPASTGNLKKSLRREILNDGLTASVFTDLNYAMFLHGDGMSDRSRPFTIPAKEAMAGGTLYRWAAKNSLNPWAVRWGIHLRGIRHNPFMQKTADMHQPELKEILGKSLGKIVAHLSD